MPQKTISMRLDEETAQVLDKIKQKKSQTSTEVIKAAIWLLYKESLKKGDVFSELESLGVIGVTDLSSNLSRDYKKALSKGLERKHSRGKK